MHTRLFVALSRACVSLLLTLCLLPWSTWAKATVDMRTEALAPRPFAHPGSLSAWQAHLSLPSRGDGTRLQLPRVLDRARHLADVFLDEAGQGLIYIFLLTTGAALGNFLIRHAATQGIHPSVRMLLLWAPGTIAFVWSQWNGLRSWLTPRDGLFPASFKNPLLWGLLTLAVLGQVAYALTFSQLSAVAANAVLSCRPVLLFAYAVLVFKERGNWGSKAWVHGIFFAGVWLTMPAEVWSWASAFAVLTLVVTCLFYVTQKHFKQSPVDPIGFTAMSGAVNTLFAIGWVAATFWTGSNGVSDGFSHVSWWMMLGFSALSAFSLFFRYAGGMKNFQSMSLSRSSVGDFFGQPIHAGLNLLFFGSSHASHWLSAMGTIVQLCAVFLGLRQVDFKLSDIQNQREALQTDLAQEQWPPAVGVLVPGNPNVLEWMRASVQTLARLLGERGLPPRSGDPRLLTRLLNHTYRSALANPEASTEQSVRNDILFLQQVDHALSRVFYAAHHGIRKLSFLIGFKGIFVYPGGIHTWDKFLEVWVRGRPVFLIEQGSESTPYWKPILNILKKLWMEHEIPLPHTDPELIASPSQIDDAIEKVANAQPIQNFAASFADSNAELKSAIERLETWRRAIVFLGSPQDHSVEWQEAFALAKALLDQGQSVRFVEPSLLFEAVWAYAVENNVRDRVQWIVSDLARRDNVSTPESTLVIRDLLINFRIVITKHTVGHVILPADLVTLSHLFDILTFYSEHPIKRRPIAFLGRDRFWRPFSQTLEDGARALGISRSTLLPTEAQFDRAGDVLDFLRPSRSVRRAT